MELACFLPYQDIHWHNSFHVLAVIFIVDIEKSKYMNRLIKYAIAGVVIGLLLENRTLIWRNEVNEKKHQVKDGLRKKLHRAKERMHHA